MVYAYPLFPFDPCAKTTNGVPYKVYRLKRKIIAALAHNQWLTVAEMAVQMGVSTPTIAKLIAELIAEGYVCDNGKIETQGGRRPCSFSLVPTAGCFLGVELDDHCARFALSDMSRTVVQTFQIDHSETVANHHRMLEQLVELINQAIDRCRIDREKVLGVGVVLRGRVDSMTGHSHNYLVFSGQSTAELLSKKLKLNVIVENDTRAVTYAEHLEQNKTKKLRHSLFVFAGRGVGVGIVVDGTLYYGKSGFSGEFGHTPFFENQHICTCGKKGCLETEVSGSALERIFAEAMKKGASSILSEQYAKTKHVSFEQIVEAAKADDVLSIELIGAMGEKLGRGVGVLINIFNPEAIIIGGALAVAGDYLMLPLRASLAKYSLSLVNNDTVLSLSSTGVMGAAIGGALLTRSRVLAV